MPIYAILTKNRKREAIESTNVDAIIGLCKLGYLNTGMTLEAATESEALVKYNKIKSKSGGIKRWVMAAVLIVPVLFGYGVMAAAYDYSEGLSIFGAAMRVSGMNPISAEGYKIYINAQPEFKARMNKISNLGK